MTPVRGEGLDPAARVEVVNVHLETLPAGASWALRGVTRNLRYTTRDEKERLSAIQGGQELLINRRISSYNVIAF
jgi:hypothetical protein